MVTLGSLWTARHVTGAERRKWLRRTVLARTVTGTTSAEPARQRRLAEQGCLCHVAGTSDTLVRCS